MPTGLRKCPCPRGPGTAGPPPRSPSDPIALPAFPCSAIFDTPEYNPWHQNGQFPARLLVGRYLSVRTRAEGGTPRFLWRETLEKPDNAVIIDPPADGNKGFGGPAAQSVQFISIKFKKLNWQPVPPPAPVTSATSPGSATAAATAESPAFPAPVACQPAPSAAS